MKAAVCKKPLKVSKISFSNSGLHIPVSSVFYLVQLA